VEPPCPMKAARQAPVWTNGPPFPSASPPATEPMLPMNFPTSVLVKRIPGTSMPFRCPLISGIPLPATEKKDRTQAKARCIYTEIKTWNSRELQKLTQRDVIFMEGTFMKMRLHGRPQTCCCGRVAR